MPTLTSGVYRPPYHLETPREQYNDVLRSDPCAWCSLRPGGTIEHVIASGVGGDNTARNIVGACPACNGEKGTRSLLLFLLKRVTITG